MGFWCSRSCSNAFPSGNKRAIFHLKKSCILNTEDLENREEVKEYLQVRVVMTMVGGASILGGDITHEIWEIVAVAVGFGIRPCYGCLVVKLQMFGRPHIIIVGQNKY